MDWNLEQWETTAVRMDWNLEQWETVLLSEWTGI
jgi:hypothetical protein